VNPKKNASLIIGKREWASVMGKTKAKLKGL
jgi:hypothetical protein